MSIGYIDILYSGSISGATITGDTIIASNITTNNLSVTGNSNANIYFLSATTLSASTIQSSGLGGNGTQMVVANSSGVLSVQAIPSAGQSTNIQNGLNTYTGGTETNPTVNVSALTINTIVASGSSVFTGGLSATTISGGTFYGDGSNITGITGSFGITIDGAGSVITSGIKGFFVSSDNRIITGWKILSDVSGSCSVDIWKNTTIPTSANTITGSQIPTLNNQQINYTNNLNTWSTSVYENDILYFNVISASTLTKINLVIKTIKNI